MQVEYSYQERKKEHRIFSLTENGIQSESTKKGSSFLPYSDIAVIRLLSPMKGVFACLIKGKNGEKLTIANRSFISMGKFDFKNDEYKAFLQALHEKTQNQPGIQYQSGSSALYWFLIISLPIIAVLLATMLYLKMKFPNRMRIPYSIFMLIFAFPLILHYLKQGKGKNYEAKNLPENFLP